jgi:hypothetical protein
MLARNDLLLLAVVVLVAFSYFYQVPANPPGFYIDEASIAYNAYTIAETGKDEYGESWPLYFRAFGEYKNPVYIYILSALFRIFGPSILLARLLSATLGVTTVLLLWWLAYRLSHRSVVASFVAISAAFTPWLFENSRLVFEVALYPTLFLLFLLTLHRASQREHWNLSDSIPLIVEMVLLTYSYSIGRMFVPLLALGLLFFVTRNRLRAIATIWVVYSVTLIPAFLFNYQHGGALMFRFWLLTYITPQSSFLEIAGNFFTHYLANINPWTIAVTGENNVRDHVGNVGSVLAPTLLLSITGIIFVVVQKHKEAWWRYILYALAIAPIPASLTVTTLPQIRLIAMPVLLHVVLIPSVSWLWNRSRLALGIAMLSILVMGTIHRWEFRQAGPERWYIFDEQFPREVFPTALAQNKTPIYFQDPSGKSGYAEAYWYGVLRGMPLDSFVRLPPETKPPDGAVVISTAEECTDCELLLKSINYIVFISRTDSTK